MKYKKAQIGIEFIIIMGAVMFFITIFFVIIQNNTEEKTYRRENIIAKEIAITVQNEIDLALQSIDGYSRSFDIPNKVGNIDYEINITSGVVYVRTVNNRHALALPVAVVVGNVNIPNNTIRKNLGVIYLNQ